LYGPTVKEEYTYLFEGGNMFKGRRNNDSITNKKDCRNYLIPKWQESKMDCRRKV